MSAASSHRSLLVAAALVSATAVFVDFLLFEIPGLGIGHFYYISIALFALATGPWIGAAGGVGATILYALGIYLNPLVPTTEIVSVSTGIRLFTYTAIGGLIGWFASNNRGLVERLRILAERDSLTGLPNTRSFEAAITRRFDTEKPFALLLGDMDGLKRINEQRGQAVGDDVLRRLADMLGNCLGPEDELARVGGDEFAVLTSCRTTVEASRMCARLEAVLADEGANLTFGWSVCPQEGLNALSLYRAADERLYARKLIRRQALGNAVPLRAAPETP